MKKSALFLLILSSLAFAETEEQRLIRISKNLKPISDSQWNDILGDNGKEIYDVQKGDNLWTISKKLFGNSHYWPKVWSINNHGIGNPHILEPGAKLTFIPGTSESAPRLTVNSSGSSSGQSLKEEGGSPQAVREHEYDKVSSDRWAKQDITKELNVNYDNLGFDKDLRVSIPTRFVFRVPSVANDVEFPYLGEITGSRREGVGLGQFETVFIKSQNQDLQVGVTYSVLSTPEKLGERRSDRTALIYHSIGEVKIIGVKDDLYIGVIDKAYDVIRRGDKLFPLLPLITDIKPVPANQALEAVAFFSSSKSTRNSAQFHFIHIDRGLEDGLQIGNIFRVYEYFDPTNQKKITDSDFLIQADAIVVHATAQFSTALVIRSRDTFSSGDFGVLLTDVSDLEKKLRDAPQLPDSGRPEDKELDELDLLDQSVGEGLGRHEEEEIKELENWDKTKDMQTQPNEEPTIPAEETPSDQFEQFPSDSTGTNTGEPAIEPGTEPAREQSLEEVGPESKSPKSNERASEPFQATPGVEPLQQAPADDVEQKK